MTASTFQEGVRERVPGLDGLRAVAVVAVLLFHLRMGYASGGFLGVSLFFTLSGYLITRLLLDEHRASGTISLRNFWARRLRRLMPAAFVALGLITIVAVSSDVFQSATLRGDLWAALGYVANWRFMSASTSYADLFVTAPSPVLHFWSLAIEEQFYFVFPILLLAMLRRNRSRWVAFVGLGLLWMASVASSLVGASDNVVYYGAHTRAAELLTGSLLALLMAHQTKFGVTTASLSSGIRYFWNAATAVALGVVVFLIITVETGDRWLYQGGLAAFSLLSALLVVGIQVAGPFQWLAERRVVKAVGQVSYGLYLFHWPIFLLINEDRTGLSGITLHGLRLVATVAISVVVMQLIENPIRRNRILSGVRVRSGALVIGLMTLAGAIVFVPRLEIPALAGLDAPDTVVEFGGTDTTPKLIVAVFGNQAQAVTDIRQIIGDDQSTEVIDATDSTCPVTTFAFARDGCPSIASRLDAFGVRDQPDLVVVGFGSLERDLLEASLLGADEEIFDIADRYFEGVMISLGARESILIDYGTPDVLSGTLEGVGLGRPTISSIQQPTLELLNDLYSVVATKAGGADQRERLMVIGDSSSFGVSAAIDAVAGDQINVLWAGGQNCPLVEVEMVKWWEGVEFDLGYCPTLNSRWIDLVSTFRPDRVLVVVTVPEQSEQKYPGDPNWYEVSDAIFQQVHEAFMNEFMDLLTINKIDLVMFNSPLIRSGALSGADFAQEERVNGWNQVIQRWATNWPQITVIDWAAIIERLESEQGPLRSDGVHLEQPVLNGIVADEVIPALRVASLSQ
ncbi:MAG: hypothetical protein RL119_1354 [Actinomycetota bacterium]